MTIKRDSETILFCAMNLVLFYCFENVGIVLNRLLLGLDEERFNRPACVLDEHSIKEPNSEDKQHTTLAIMTSNRQC